MLKEVEDVCSLQLSLVVREDHLDGLGAWLGGKQGDRGEHVGPVNLRGVFQMSQVDTLEAGQT